MSLPLVTLSALLLAFPPDHLMKYTGVWKLVAEESDNIPAAIDRVVRKMNFLIRGIARSRLRKTQIAFPVIEITSSGSEFRIRHEGGTSVPHPDATSVVNAKAPDGAAIQVGLQPGPPLRETYSSKEGFRENTYLLSADGTKMTLEVRVTSPRLPEPIQYRLVYGR